MGFKRTYAWGNGFVKSVQNETNRMIKNVNKNYFLNLGEKLSNYNTGSELFGQRLGVWLMRKNALIYPLVWKTVELFPTSARKAIFLMIISLVNVL